MKQLDLTEEEAIKLSDVIRWKVGKLVSEADNNPNQRDGLLEEAQNY